MSMFSNPLSLGTMTPEQQMLLMQAAQGVGASPTTPQLPTMDLAFAYEDAGTDREAQREVLLQAEQYAKEQEAAAQRSALLQGLVGAGLGIAGNAAGNYGSFGGQLAGAAAGLPVYAEAKKQASLDAYRKNLADRGAVNAALAARRAALGEQRLDLAKQRPLSTVKVQTPQGDRVLDTFANPNGGDPIRQYRTNPDGTPVIPAVNDQIVYSTEGIFGINPSTGEVARVPVGMPPSTVRPGYTTFGQVPGYDGPVAITINPNGSTNVPLAPGGVPIGKPEAAADQVVNPADVSFLVNKYQLPSSYANAQGLVTPFLERLNSGRMTKREFDAGLRQFQDTERQAPSDWALKVRKAERKAATEAKKAAEPPAGPGIVQQVWDAARGAGAPPTTTPAPPAPPPAPALPPPLQAQAGWLGDQIAKQGFRTASQIKRWLMESQGYDAATADQMLAIYRQALAAEGGQ